MPHETSMMDSSDVRPERRVCTISLPDSPALTLTSPWMVQAGWTSLFYATVRNEPELVERLLTCGADPEHRDKKGVKAIDWAEHLGFDDTCSVFEDFASRLVPSRTYL